MFASFDVSAFWVIANMQGSTRLITHRLSLTCPSIMKGLPFTNLSNRQLQHEFALKGPLKRNKMVCCDTFCAVCRESKDEQDSRQTARYCGSIETKVHII